MNWFIDAWAPTEGMVFASQRGDAEDLWNLEVTGSVTTFAIAAPDFEPRLADRSQAFGAIRRGFQERYSIDGQSEFSFESLAQLTTLVRRFYLGSGPGTMGGGDGGEPPPEPRPPTDGARIPEAFALNTFDTEVDSPDISGRPLTQALRRVDSAERARMVSSWFSPTVAQAAARLLVDCAAEAMRLRSFPDAHRLALTAAGLMRSAGDFHSLVAFAEIRGPQIHALVDRLLDWPRYWSTTPLAAGHASLGDVGRTRVPNHVVRAAGLPASVRTMQDVLSYISADRLFLERSSSVGLLTLLLAVAANFRTHNLNTHRYGSGVGVEFDELMTDDYGRVIAAWLFVEPLPAVLEAEVQAWCWLGPRRQRGQSGSEGAMT